MNHIHRLVFNAATGLYQVVSELGSKSQGRGARAGVILPHRSGQGAASGPVWAASGGIGDVGNGFAGGAAGVTPSGHGGAIMAVLSVLAAEAMALPSLFQVSTGPSGRSPGGRFRH